MIEFIFLLVWMIFQFPTLSTELWSYEDLSLFIDEKPNGSRVNTR